MYKKMRGGGVSGGGRGRSSTIGRGGKGSVGIGKVVRRILVLGARGCR